MQELRHNLTVTEGQHFEIKPMPSHYTFDIGIVSDSFSNEEKEQSNVELD